MEREGVGTSAAERGSHFALFQSVCRCRMGQWHSLTGGGWRSLSERHGLRVAADRAMCQAGDIACTLGQWQAAATIFSGMARGATPALSGARRSEKEPRGFGELPGQEEMDNGV